MHVVLRRAGIVTSRREVWLCRRCYAVVRYAWKPSSMERVSLLALFKDVLGRELLKVLCG